MAKIEFKLPEDFLQKVSQLEEKTDEIIPRVLETGGNVVLEQVRSNLQAVVGRGTKYPSQSTGELTRNLGLSPVKMDKNGDFNVKVGFSEPHSGGVTNAMLANILEYGKHGQPPKPFLKPAKSQSRVPCIEAMKRKLEEEMDNL